MKRKLQIAMLLAVSLAGAGTFTSCKDYEEDLRNELRQTNLTFEDKIAALTSRVEALEKAQKECEHLTTEQVKKLLQDQLAVPMSQLDERVAKVEDALKKIVSCQCVDPLTKEQVAKQIEDALKGAGVLTQDGQPTLTEAEIKNIKDQVAKIATLVTDLAELQKTVADIKAYTDNLPETISALEAKVNAIKPGISKEEAEKIAKTEAEKIFEAHALAVSNALNTLQTTLNTRIDEEVASLNSTISGLSSELGKLVTKLSEVEQTATTALQVANANKKTLEAMDVTVQGINGRLGVLEAAFAAAQGYIAANAEAIKAAREDMKNMQEQIDDLLAKYNALEGKVGALETQIATLASQEDLDKLTARVKANEDDILALQGDVAKLLKIYDRLNSLVTSIEIQRVVNPLFGAISTPLGIETSILVNYWGQYNGVKPLNFPSYNNVEGYEMLTAADAKMLQGLFTPQTFNNGDYMMEDCGLGTVYLTINPSNVNFTGGNLVLSTSNGRGSAIELRNVRPCNEELKFGYTRGNNSNGFYTADAYLPMTSANVANTKLNIVPGLESAVKDVVTDRSRSAVVNLMKKVYQQLTNGLPAYGVKAAWTANDGMGEKEYSVMSKCGIAATTFRPLSYNTLKGTSINHRLPTFSPLKSAVDYLNEFISKDRFHFDLGNPTISIKSVDVNFNLGHFELSSNAEVWATSPGVVVKGTLDNGETFETVTDPIKVNVSSQDLEPLIKDLQAQLNGKIDRWNGDMDKVISDAMNDMVDQMQSEVSKVIKDLQGNINDQIGNIVDDILGDIGGKLQPAIDKVNSFIDKYNSIANRLNNVLADPKHYLQVTMLYNTGNGGIHFLSNNPNDPTWFNKAGGSGLSLYATSYTAELAAPAYRKFVAVTDVKAPNGKSAKGGDAALQADLKSINQGGTLCKVLTGRAKRIAVPTAKMKSGYTYELVYTAIDYRGYTSTQHFYIYVN